MHVVLRQVVGYAGQAGVHVAAAQVLGRDDLARGGLDQRRPPRKMVPWFFTMMDSSLIAAHRRRRPCNCP